MPVSRMRDLFLSLPHFSTLLLFILAGATLPNAHALKFSGIPTTATPGPFSFTYTNEATDPTGNMTLWLSHIDGAGGSLHFVDDIAQETTATTVTANILDVAADGQQWVIEAGPLSSLPDGIFATSDPFIINAVGAASGNSLSASASGTSSQSNTISASSPASSPSTPTSDPASSPSNSTNFGTANTPNPAGPTGSATFSGSSGTPSSSSSSGSALPDSALAKSSTPVGTIVGASIGGVAGLAIIGALLLCFLRRRRRQAQLDAEIARAVNAQSSNTYSSPTTYSAYSSTSQLNPSSSSNRNAYLNVNPYPAPTYATPAPVLSPYNTQEYAHAAENSGRASATAEKRALATNEMAAAPTGDAPVSLGPSTSKAARERQAFLTNQLRNVQAQLDAFRVANPSSAVSPSSTSGLSPISSPSPQLDSTQAAPSAPSSTSTATPNENAALHARIAELEAQLRSQWALGLSDEPPPGYIE